LVIALFVTSERDSAPTPPDRKRHHIGDYLPSAEYKKFLSRASGQAEDEANKLDESNKGYQLLKNLGWSEGTNDFSL